VGALFHTSAAVEDLRFYPAVDQVGLGRSPETKQIWILESQPRASSSLAILRSPFADLRILLLAK
jgi:hypothetical protein